MSVTTGAEIVLNWIKAYKKQNGEYPYASEIESQLIMAIDAEKLLKQYDLMNQKGMLFKFIEHTDAEFIAKDIRDARLCVDSFLSKQ